MNKDLSKEYKEAVLNDLPDLWGRIEAAIDEQEKSNGNETADSNVIQFKREDTDKEVNITSSQTAVQNETSDVQKTGANKYAVNAYDNEPVSKVSTKKRKRIPSWVYITLPSVAIILLIILPVAFFASRAGLSGTKNYSTATMSVAESADFGGYTDAAVASAPTESEDDYRYYDEIEEDIAFENAVTVTAETNSDGSVYSHTKESEKDLTFADNVIDDFDDASFLTGTTTEPGVKTDGEEADIIVNECVTVSIVTIYESEDINVAEVYIEEIKGEFLCDEDEVQDIKEGGEIMLVLPDSSYETGKTYDVAIRFVPDAEFIYEIIPTEE